MVYVMKNPMKLRMVYRGTPFEETFIVMIWLVVGDPAHLLLVLLIYLGKIIDFGDLAHDYGKPQKISIVDVVRVVNKNWLVLLIS